MKAINEFLIIKILKDETTSVGGLELTETTNDTRYKRATILSVGDKVQVVKESDIVQFDKHSGFPISIKNTLYHVISIRDIVIIE
jgi:co-chaperonin GroES (HSP10)